MITVKVRLRSRSFDGDKGKEIYYQVIHNRVVRQVSTGYSVYDYEWDDKCCDIRILHDTGRVDYLVSLREKIRRDMDRFNRIITLFTRRNIHFCADDVVAEFRSLSSRLSLSGFMEKIIDRLNHDGKIRTGEAYRSALNSFMRFRNGEDVTLDTFSGELMETYEAYLHAKGLIPNTSSFYLRILRSVYNRAREQGLIETQCNPFSHVYTGVGKTEKRAVNIDVIKRIKDLDLTDDAETDYARDIFMLSFYLRGMSFVDLAYLKKNDIVGDFVIYRRRKTGQRLTVRWTKEMQAVVDKYHKNETEYFLPIITSCTASPRSQYKLRHYEINNRLKEVGRKIGLPMPLTMYVARHSWASIAKLKGIPVSVISEGLGHDSERTTRIYLASLSTSAVDQANDIILASL